MPEHAAIPSDQIDERRHTHGRWFLRVIMLGIAGLACLVLLRLWWGYEADCRLASAIAVIRASGEPATRADFDAVMDRVPDRDNAAVPLQRAIAVLTTSNGLLQRPGGFLRPIAEADEAALAQILTDNAKAIDYVHEAWRRPRVVWRTRLGDAPDADISQQQRALARLLLIAAEYEFLLGDDASAIDYLEDVLRLGDAIAIHPSRISSLIAGPIYSFVCNRLEEHVFSMCIDEDGPASIAARREQIERMQARFLNEDVFRDAARVGLLCERADALSDAAAERWTPWSPVNTLDAVRLADWLTAASDVLKHRTTVATAESTLSRFQERRTLLHMLTRRESVSWSGDALGTVRWSMQAFDRFVAYRRMAGIALALRLHELDHGFRPDSLAALVPEYLSEVPRDPFDPDVGAIRYLPDDETPRLYSLGPNSEDDGGTDPRGTGWRATDWAQRDIVFRLDGRAPRRGP